MAAKVINLSEVIDQPRLTGLQVRVMVLCALVSMLDGLDTQSIGVAAPMIAERLGVSRAALGPVFSAALFGAMIGALSFGMLADRFGRKRILILSAAGFGLFTILTALADSYNTLLAYRFLAGLGLGGAVPCFVALASEYAPKSQRAMMASLMFAGFPLGGMIGGFLNSYIIQQVGWHAIFYVGGGAALIVALALAAWLPESLRFLLASGRDPEGVKALIGKLAPQLIAADAAYVADEEKLPGAPLRNLFTQGRGPATIFLWVPFFMGFGALAISVLWTPALLRQNGIDAAATAFIVAFNGLGSLIGSAIAGRLLQRFGASVTLVPAFILGALCFATFGYGAHSVPLAAIFVGLIGLFLGFSVGGSIALASLIYPTAVRSTGIGWAMGMGRFGQTITPLVAGFLVGLSWSTDRIMLAVAVAPLIGAVFIGLAGIYAQRTDEAIRDAAIAPGAQRGA